MTQEIPKRETSKPVVKGSVVKPKESTLKRVYHIFFATDPADALRSVITNVIFPDVQYTLNNVWKRFGDVMLYGADEAIPKSNSRGRDYHGVRSGGSSSSRNRSAFAESGDRRGARLDEFKEFGFTRREDAVEIVIELRDAVEEYGYVDVARVYEIIGPDMGVEAMPIHYKWGWLDDAVFDPNRNVEMGHDGYWHIAYPKIRKL